MGKAIRVRFAPSPTGGLHIGGVRTALYNYLFARQQGGRFIVRIEDTDQTRFVPGAEDYIFDTLAWCGIEPDESPRHGGEYGPYRQSERKALYREYAERLVAEGKAYYAFDTPGELERMREAYRNPENPSPQYDHRLRGRMRNSLSLTENETRQLLDQGAPHVIRIRVPEAGTVSFEDMIRGEVSFDTATLDDKVLLKADGMPTYHLAVVVDDFLMEISHVFRGEEWLPSAGIHVLLWDWLFGRGQMPAWAHFPLILKPDGNGKLSKRDSKRLGIPIFAMNWTDPATGETTPGFRETGFLPEAFLNFLALLGWNDGSEKEIFSKAELIEAFRLERVHKAGAKLNVEKAKWFNHEWMTRIPGEELARLALPFLAAQGLEPSDGDLLQKVVTLVAPRCSLLTDLYAQTHFFFRAPATWDLDAVKPKWSADKAAFFAAWSAALAGAETTGAAELEAGFKDLAASRNLKAGELQLPLRIMLVGEKTGPPVFEISALIGKAETVARVEKFLGAIR